MFKEIEGFSAYRISESGEIQSCWQWGSFYGGMKSEKKWKTLHPRYNDGGYIPLNLRDVSGKSRRTHVHRLVAETFISPLPFKNACVRHLDGNAKNNNVKNLAWGTYLDNENDKFLHGTHKSRISNSKLTIKNISEIKEMGKQGLTHFEISKKFCVSRPTISRLLSGKTWSME